MSSSDRQVFDTSVAHSARVHNYWLGGKDNFAADRAAGDAVIAAYPGIVASVREPGVVAVPHWRPASEIEARAHSAMWGGVGLKR